MAKSKNSRSARSGSVGSAEFRARCLELIDRVRESRAEYVVTRHGRPVARVVPVGPSAQPGFVGSMRGSVLAYDGPFDPIPGVWDVHAPTDRDS